MLGPLVATQVFEGFGNLTQPDAYVADTPPFRQKVALAYLLSYSVGLCALVLLPLTPRQKAHAREWMERTPRRRVYALCCVLLVAFAIGYAVRTIDDILEALVVATQVGGGEDGASVGGAR